MPVALASRYALALMVVALAAPTARSDEGTPPRIIRYESDTLTVRLTQVPLTEILEDLGHQAGAQIRGGVREPRDVSAEFEAVPLAEALHRLLGDQNFALVYGRDGALKSVRLLGGPQTGIGLLAIPRAGQPQDVRSLLANHGAVPVGGLLSSVLGGQQATLPQLLDLGARNADAAVRSEATGTLLATIDGDANLRISIAAQLAAMDDATLTTLLRNGAGEHAEELVTRVMNAVQVPEIRSKASAVLQRLRTGG